MKENSIVAEYDYYTLEQASKIIMPEIRKITAEEVQRILDAEIKMKRKKRKRKKRIEELKYNMILFIFYGMIPMVLVWSWIIFGY